MGFTFGVLTYNQEKMILETLESIKYQIEHYADSEAIDLILIDDASGDRTVDIAREWLTYRKNLFKTIELIVNKQNMGTVHNYNLLIKQINNPFKIIAGDDLIASGNIISKVKKLDKDTINTYVCVSLLNGKILYSEFRSLLFFKDSLCLHIKNYAIRAVRRGWFFHTPSTHYTKELFEKARCRDCNKKFRLFEDDPTWYAMIKNIDDININFIADVVVLYRIHEESVSNGAVYSSAFSNEIDILHKQYYRETKGLEHILFWFKLHGQIPKIFRIDKYIDKLRIFYMHHVIKQRKDYKKFEKYIKTIIKKEQEYYKQILANVDYYVTEMGLSRKDDDDAGN